MRRQPSLLLSGILLLAWASSLLASRPALASQPVALLPGHDHCICAQPVPPPPAAFAQSGAVFVGTVVDKARPNDRPAYVDWLNQIPGIQLRGFAVWRITFDVGESWRGVTATSIMLRTWHGVDCGYHFSLGGQYLIYAYQGRYGWETNACTRTTDIASAADDMSYLATLPRLKLSRPLAQQVFWGSVALMMAAILVISARWIRREMVRGMR